MDLPLSPHSIYDWEFQWIRFIRLPWLLIRLLFDYSTQPLPKPHWTRRYFMAVSILRWLVEHYMTPPLLRLQSSPLQFYQKILRLRQNIESQLRLDPKAIERSMNRHRRQRYKNEKENPFIHVRFEAAVVQRIPDQVLQEVAPDARHVLPTPLSDRLAQLIEPTGEGMPAEWTDTSHVDPFHPERFLLFLHGGSIILMSPQSHRDMTARLAKETRARVYAIDYRLAPLHPFPAALYDAVSAYIHLLKQHALDAKRVVVCGNSAGGGLGVALLLFLRQHRLELSRVLRQAGYWTRAEDIPMPGAGLFFSPWSDITLSLLSTRLHRRSDYLIMEQHEGWLSTPADQSLVNAGLLYSMGMDALLLNKAYPEGTLDKLYEHIRNNVYLCPALSADLSWGLPPILIQVGGAETLLSEALALQLRSCPGLMTQGHLDLVQWTNALTYHLNTLVASSSIHVPTVVPLVKLRFPRYIQPLLNTVQEEDEAAVAVEVYPEMVHTFVAFSFMKASRVAYTRAGSFVQRMTEGLRRNVHGIVWMEGCQGESKSAKRRGEYW